MNSDGDSDQIALEASAWFAKLNTHRVDVQTLQDFQAWRRDPVHDAAYERAQKTWKDIGAVRDDPAVAVALREAKARIEKARKKEGLPLPLVTATGLAVVALGFIGVAGVNYFAPHRYETAVGQQKSITLADGSAVRLDTHSVIEVRFTGKERFVKLLAGQAMFDVVHSAARPFHVAADGLDVRDLGTSFDVRRDGGHAVVTVVSGAVEVSAPTRVARWTLSAGQQVETNAASPRPVDVKAFTRWTTGRVEFDDVSLAEAAKEMNRYAAHPIILANDEVGQLHVSGAFDTIDTPGFTKALTDIYGVVVTRRSDGRLELSPPKAPTTA